MLVKISNCFLFDVTEQGNPTQDPVVWWLDCRQHHCCDVVQVCALWLLVDGANVKLRIRRGSGVDSEHVNDRQGCKQHFGWGLDETGVLSVPASTINVQTIDINSLLLKEGSQWQDSPLFYSLFNKKKSIGQLPVIHNFQKILHFNSLLVRLWSPPLCAWVLCCWVWPCPEPSLCSLWLLLASWLSEILQTSK